MSTDKTKKAKKDVTRREVLKLIGAGAASVAATSVLSGCGAAPAAAPQQAPTAQSTTFTPVPTVAREVTVRHWMHLAPPDPLMHQFVKDFNEEYKGKIRVEFEEIPWDGIYQKLTTAIAAGDPPDTAELHDNWIGAFGKGDWALPLDDYFAKWQYKDTIPQSLLDTGRTGAGKSMIRLPYNYVVTFLYYRSDWFEEAGVKPPTTHEEFLEVCKAITRPEENRYAYGMRGSRNGQFHWEPFIEQAGGAYVDENGKIVINSEDAKAGNQFYADLFLKHQVCRPSGITDGWPEILDGLQKGEIGMFIHTINIANLLTEALGDKIAVTKLPKGKREASTAVANGFQILRGCKHPDEAWEWVSYVCRPENQKRILYNPDISLIPVSTTVADDPKFKEPLYQISFESAKSVVPLPLWLPTYGEFVEKEWSPTFQSVLLGEMEADAMMDHFAEFLSGEA